MAAYYPRSTTTKPYAQPFIASRRSCIFTSRVVVTSIRTDGLQTQDTKNENRIASPCGFRHAVRAARSSADLSAAQSKPAADLIIRNAKVWTVDKDHPTAQAVAVLGDRIVAVGSNADVEAWHGPHTRTIDASGKLLLPGFNDSHVHFVDGGLSLDSVQLNDATSATEFARRIGEQAKKTPKGEWVTSGDWDETKWTPPAMPTKELIDPLTPDTPVFVSRYDGHMALANSVTLRLAGITAQTPDPPGGVIVRDAQGNPTGALKDAAMDYVYKIAPPLSHDARLRAVKRALAHAASLGVTSVQHMNPEYDDIAVYAELLRARRIDHAHLCRAAYYRRRRSGENRHPARLWGPISAHRRAQGLRRRLARFGHRLLLRALQQSAQQPRPALR